MSKDAYHTLCRTEESIPIFSQEWWLDAVCGESNWDVLLTEENNRVQAAWPLYMPLRGIVTMP
ncbi:MAG: GNAT family N-acetyltransferase, partial [Tannerella sp.]|nr:GNAT family N-acetyltransferase [Tannerella sp.]